MTGFTLVRSLSWCLRRWYPGRRRSNESKVSPKETTAGSTVGLELAGELGSGEWAPQGHEDKWEVSHDSVDFGRQQALWRYPHPHH